MILFLCLLQQFVHSIPPVVSPSPSPWTHILVDTIICIPPKELILTGATISLNGQLIIKPDDISINRTLACKQPCSGPSGRRLDGSCIDLPGFSTQRVDINECGLSTHDCTIYEVCNNIDGGFECIKDYISIPTIPTSSPAIPIATSSSISIPTIPTSSPAIPIATSSSISIPTIPTSSPAIPIAPSSSISIP